MPAPRAEQGSERGRVDPAERYRDVVRRVVAACRRSGRDPGSVAIVAATKTVPVERLLTAVEAGLRHVGENRLQEAEEKLPALPDEVVRHFIGRLQSNKAGRVVRQFDWIHSVDRVSLARAVARHAERNERVQRVLVQLDLAGEPTKGGVAPGALDELLRACAELPAIEVKGLMAIPPYQADPEASRPYFRRLRELALEAGQRLGRELEHLSMGMTEDFEVAVEEGATFVRIGRALFGERPAANGG